LFPTTEYPHDKIKLICEYSDKIDITFDKIFTEFFDNNLRNAFSHSQYYTSSDGDVEISKYSTPTLSSSSKSGKRAYNYNEIIDLYDKSRSYIKIFIKCYKKFIEPYMDGKAYLTLFGSINFDKKHGWGFVQSK
jgi:hypothetical protein